jgi:molybdate transport system permease protein
MSSGGAILLLTIAAASASTILIAVPGIAAGFALARYRGRWSAVLETVLSLPLVLPPTAVGLLLLQFLRIAPGVVFTFRAVVIATAVMSFPLLVRSARTAFEEVDPRLLQVARTLGASRFRTFREVALPLAKRGVLSGLILAFSRALGEFGATILVAGNIPGETQTLALAIFQRTQAGDDAGALRLVAVTVALAFVAIWSTELLTRRA